MSTLYIDRKDLSVELDGAALVFRVASVRCGTVPIAPLKRVIIRGSVALDASLLGKLGAAGVGVIILSGRKAEPTLMMPRPHGDGSRRLMQYRAATDPVQCLSIARLLVAAKLDSQIEWLALKIEQRPLDRYVLTRAIRALAGMRGQLPRTTDIAQLRGLEGAAAAQYFAAYAELVPASLNFCGRNRRPPKDPVNAVLSLAYTLLHSEAVLTAHACGLDPYIGFYHTPAHSRESLASDLIETCRPVVDAWALQLFASQTLRCDDFSTSADGCLLGKAGRTRFYQGWNEPVEQLRRRLEQQAYAIVAMIDLPNTRVTSNLNPKIAADKDLTVAVNLRPPDRSQ
jgi:CRISP-associated protein Cas1